MEIPIEQSLEFGKQLCQTEGKEDEEKAREWL